MPYISKEVAIDYVKNYTPTINGETTMECVERSIMNVPTVDAVQVVRCEKCMHKGWVSEPCHGKSVDFCRLHEFVVRSDDYCSYGVLKEGE